MTARVAPAVVGLPRVGDLVRCEAYSSTPQRVTAVYLPGTDAWRGYWGDNREPTHLGRRVLAAVSFGSPAPPQLSGWFWQDEPGCAIIERADPNYVAPPAPPAPAKYRDLLLLTPPGADTLTLQLAPVPRLTTFLPARTRSVTAYHRGSAARFDLPFPALAWTFDFAVAHGRLTDRRFELHAHDPAGAGVRMARWTGANVFVGQGICWGSGVQPPTTVRAAHAAFFGAPFNSDLWPRRDAPHACDPPRPTPPHACERARTGARCQTVHACAGGSHATPHVHVCAAKRNGGPACAVAHRYPRDAANMTLSTKRARLKGRTYHLATPEEVHQFRVTLGNNFNDSSKCPCNCCAGLCRCQQDGFGCACCTGRCICTQCPCESGLCRCRRPTCRCCAGLCPCTCECDPVTDFVRHLRTYAAGPHADRTSYVRGERYVESLGRCDGVYLSSTPEALARVPAACHVLDATGVPCVAGFATRQPDESYAILVREHRFILQPDEVNL